MDGSGRLLAVHRPRGDAMPKTVVSALFNFHDVTTPAGDGRDGDGVLGMIGTARASGGGGGGRRGGKRCSSSSCSGSEEWVHSSSASSSRRYVGQVYVYEIGCWLEVSTEVIGRESFWCAWEGGRQGHGEVREGGGWGEWREGRVGMGLYYCLPVCLGLVWTYVRICAQYILDFCRCRTFFDYCGMSTRRRIASSCVCEDLFLTVHFSL